MIKAVVFDLFETLITEWGHEKYLKAQIAEDLNMEPAAYGKYEEERHETLYSGQLTYESMLKNAVREFSGEGNINAVMRRRIETKRICFDCVMPELYAMLDKIRSCGIKTGIVSNCTAEEVSGLQSSRLMTFFDTAVLSCDVGHAKPEPEIYKICMNRLGEAAEESLFVGDSEYELHGAENAHMSVAQALWYREKYQKHTIKPNHFPALYTPAALLEFIGVK